MTRFPRRLVVFALALGAALPGAAHAQSESEAPARSEEAAAPFRHGSFATIYLSPRDYHRVHMPLEGELTGTTHVPGRIFSVAPFAVRRIRRSPRIV